MKTSSCCPKAQPDQPVRPILALPVAARITARTRFASATPAADSKALLPQEALIRLENCLNLGKIAGVELDGPGDPLASIDTTLATLRLIAGRYQNLSLSLTTMGLGGDRHVDELRAAGLGRIRIRVDAVDPLYLEKIYAWIRPGSKTLALPEAARLLVEEQRRTILACKQAGIIVQILTTVYPGVNTEHLEMIAQTMAACKADGLILVPCRTEEGAGIALPAIDAAMLTAAEKNCRRHIQILNDDSRWTDEQRPGGTLSTLPQPSKQRPNVAVASSSGLDIDLHLGQAKQLLIYGPREDGLTCLLGTRPAPPPGGPGRRWQILAASLTDCYALLAASAGETPRAELAEAGITVLITEDSIEGIVDVLYGGGKKGKQCRK